MHQIVTFIKPFNIQPIQLCFYIDDS
jgi:hypothetical protein